MFEIKILLYTFPLLSLDQQSSRFWILLIYDIPLINHPLFPNEIYLSINVPVI